MNQTNKYINELETKLKDFQKKEKGWIKEQQAQIKLFKEQEQEISKLNNSLTTLTSEREKDQQKYKELSKENKKYSEQLKVSEREKKDLFSDNQKLYQAVQDGLRSYRDLEKEQKVLAEDLIAEQEKNELLEEKYNKLKEVKENIIVPTNNCCSDHEKEKEELLNQFEETRNEQGREIEKLEKENNQLDQDLNQAVDLLEVKDKRIGELEEQINKLENKDMEQNQQPKTFTCYHCKKEQGLSLLVLELPEGQLCQNCWKELRKRTKKVVETTPKPTEPWTCFNCKETKSEKPFKVKLDASLIEYSICSTCLPLIKEYNEKEKDSERELEEWE